MVQQKYRKKEHENASFIKKVFFFNLQLSAATDRFFIWKKFKTNINSPFDDEQENIFFFKNDFWKIKQQLYIKTRLFLYKKVNCQYGLNLLGERFLYMLFVFQYDRLSLRWWKNKKPIF